MRTKTQITPVSVGQAQARRDRYRHLMERHLPILFPQGVDIALDSDEPLDHLLESERFVQQCREANQANASLYQTDRWTVDVVTSGMLPDSTLLVDVLCESWLRHLRGYRLYDWQEHRSLLRQSIIVHADGFSPIKETANGYERLSYRAWINVFAFPAAIRKLKREHDLNGRYLSLDKDDDNGPEVAEPFYETSYSEAADENQVREILADVIRDFAWSRKSKAWFQQLCGNSQSMRDVARSSRVDASTISRAFQPLTRELHRSLREQFPGVNEISSRQYGDFFALIRRLFTAEDLAQLTERAVIVELPTQHQKNLRLAA